MKKLFLILAIMSPAAHAMQAPRHAIVLAGIHAVGLASILKLTNTDKQRENMFRHRCEKNQQIKDETTTEHEAKKDEATVSEHVFHLPGFTPVNDQEKKSYAQYQQEHLVERKLDTDIRIPILAAICYELIARLPDAWCYEGDLICYYFFPDIPTRPRDF